MQHSIAELHRKRQCQTITNAIHALRTWGNGALNGRWFECPHGAVEIEGHQKRPYGFIIQDGRPMLRCKVPECIKRMKTRSGGPYHDASKIQHGTPAGGAGVTEVNRVQFRERWTKKGNTTMICSEQQIHEAQVLKETEANEGTTKQQWRRITELIDKKIHYDASFKFIFKVSSIVTQMNLAKNRSDKGCKLQMNAGQQDGTREEIQVTTEPQQTLGEQIEHHQTLKKGILGTLSMMTTTDDFQELIRIEKDKQHMHAQERNWIAVTECIMEVQDLSRRQARLGELEQIRLENFIACEERIRSINHIMTITEVNDVKSV